MGTERRASSTMVTTVEPQRQEGKQASMQVELKHLETRATLPAAGWGVVLSMGAL